jgi:hypothetical protein
VIGVTFLTGRGLFYFTFHIKIPADLFLLCVYVTGFASLRLQDIPQGNGIHGNRNLWSSTTNHVEYRNAFESFLESLNLFEF